MEDPGRDRWLDRGVLAFAHQGGIKEGPASTRWTMRQAVEAGADALELDVHRSKDGVLVCFHDDTVDRATNGSGRIAELTLAELEALDPAYYFVPGEGEVAGRDEDAYVFRGRSAKEPELRIATLEGVLEDFPGIVLNLDVKETGLGVVRYEAELVDLLRRFGRSEDVIVASFHDEATEAVRRLAPELPTSAGLGATTAFVAAVMEGIEPPAPPFVALQVPRAFQGLTVVTPALVEAAHRAGVAVHVWTIDDVSEMEELVALGVDGIMSDRPSLLVETLRRLGVSWRR
jgi:glycerophosphoryl diester phosphodiesterase